MKAAFKRLLGKDRVSTSADIPDRSQATKQATGVPACGEAAGLHAKAREVRNDANESALVNAPSCGRRQHVQHAVPAPDSCCSASCAAEVLQAYPQHRLSVAATAAQASPQARAPIATTKAQGSILPPIDGPPPARRVPSELIAPASNPPFPDGWAAPAPTTSQSSERSVVRVAQQAVPPKAPAVKVSATSLLPPIDSPSLRRPQIQLDALSAASNRSAPDAWSNSPHLRSSSSIGHPAGPQPDSSRIVAAVSGARDRASIARDGATVIPLDVPMERLPAVQHLAESTWTRALTTNIKSVAQVQGALGFTPSSQPNSPYASQLGVRSSVLTVRNSSAMGYGGGGGTDALLNTMDLLASMVPAGQQAGAQGTFSTLLASMEGMEEGDSVLLPSVLPPALLAEAARSGVSLEVGPEELADLQADCPLGRGVSGTVYRATFKGQPCAVKMLAPDMLFGPGTAELQTFVQEMVVLASVRHPNIVTFLGGSLQPPHVFMIEELCDMSLEAWLYKGAHRPMNSWQQLKVALDVATGLQHLHERVPAIVHRDLKPANILIDKDWNAKISDFGLARIKTHAVISTKAPGVGSIGYMAPECFTSEDGLLTDKCDTWSLGVVLWEAVTRKRPWAGTTLPEYYREVVIRKSRLPIPMDDNVCPMALRRLISSCWCDDPEERPSCAHIVGELTRLLKYCPRD